MLLFRSARRIPMPSAASFRELSIGEAAVIAGGGDGDFGACVSACVEASGNTSNKQVEFCETKCATTGSSSGSGSGSGSGKK